MRSRYLMFLSLVALACLVAGCGGGDRSAPIPGPSAGGTDLLEVGPMVVRPASTAGFKIASIPCEYGACAFVGMYGATINYLASQALLDRVVMVSDRGIGPGQNVWVCNLDGTGLTRITSNDALELDPHWSHDGRRIALTRKWSGQDAEIVVVNADGSGPVALTSNAAEDRSPSWSPDDMNLAFESDRSGNNEVMAMADDGRNQTFLTLNAASDKTPSWSPEAERPDIIFATNRNGNYDVFKMQEDGTNQSPLITSTLDDLLPAWSADAEEIAWTSFMGGLQTVMVFDAQSTQRHALVRSGSGPDHPAWSSTGEWVAHEDTSSGHRHIFIKQTREPYLSYQVTSGVDNWYDPHLGSPTMQTERVLIGPNGSDWGGANPVWSNAYAGIVAYSYLGYFNFVRIGVAAGDAASVRIIGLADVSRVLAVAVVKATAIANLREDAGRGKPPTVWQLGTPSPGAVILHFHPLTGKLVAALASADTVLPADADPHALVSYRDEGDTVVASGGFSAAFDAEGRNVAPNGADEVAISASGTVSVIR